MEKLVLVADCGSTSCEWRLIDSSDIALLPVTAGFNPTYEPVVNLANAIDGNEPLKKMTNVISEVRFYGAGCASEDARAKVRQQLQSHFQHAEIEVKSDIWGAARAVYRGNPIICGILGTGSNACRFDGANIEFATPSLGYILGDEGSGNHIGRLLVRSYFYETMPAELRSAFEAEYDLSLSNILQMVYQQPNASGTLAQYARFAKAKLDHPFVRELVSESMRGFLTHFVCRFKAAKEIEFAAVGSVAFHFGDILKSEATKLNISTGPILQRPIDQLAEYHRLHR